MPGNTCAWISNLRCVLISVWLELFIVIFDLRHWLHKLWFTLMLNTFRLKRFLSSIGWQHFLLSYSCFTRCCLLSLLLDRQVNLVLSGDICSEYVQSFFKCTTRGPLYDFPFKMTRALIYSVCSISFEIEIHKEICCSFLLFLVQSKSMSRVIWITSFVKSGYPKVFQCNQIYFLWGVWRNLKRILDLWKLEVLGNLLLHNTLPNLFVCVWDWNRLHCNLGKLNLV